MRWDKAVTDCLVPGVSHAFGIFDMTLCGIQEAGMSPSDHWWLSEREDAKRPQLLPVSDRVVSYAVGRPTAFWLALHAELCEDDAALHRQLLELRQVAAVPERVSAPRVCDAAVWIGHRAEGHAGPR
ncbi:MULTISPECIES: DUF6308 family protein [Streptomyces]|uniref:DUF6308 family protein n=1 Tax=Streptomyces TaxID=1883 RepID=UPI0034076619